jgi:superfamily II DNA helicase RecQ
MGVDKQEMRFVLHYDHAASLASYVQGNRSGGIGYAATGRSFSASG